jgi:hypothetical protein
MKIEVSARRFAMFALFAFNSILSARITDTLKNAKTR